MSKDVLAVIGTLVPVHGERPIYQEEVVCFSNHAMCDAHKKHKLARTNATKLLYHRACHYSGTGSVDSVIYFLPKL